jgi:hypothetical protein
MTHPDPPPAELPASHGTAAGERVAAAPRRLADLDPRQRRRVLVRSSLSVTAAWVVIIGVYYALPVGNGLGLGTSLRLTAGLTFFAVAVAWQAKRIVGSDLPEVRAVQALAVIVPLFLVIFAVIYLSIAHSSTSSFSESLDHTRALYFTVTVFSTVGFGDITPKTDFARIIVSVQMLLDLVIIGAVVRLLINAAKAGLARGEDS